MSSNSNSNSNSNYKRGHGRAMTAVAGREERARLITYVRSSLNGWMLLHGHDRDIDVVAGMLGVAPGQIHKYLSGRAVPSRETAAKMVEHGIIPADFAETRPWTEYAPDPRTIGGKQRKAAPAAAKPAPARTPAPAPAPATETEPEPASIFEALAAEEGISVANKMVLSALLALAMQGSSLAVHVDVAAGR